MNNQNQYKYSFIALIVSLLALIATVLLGITRGLAAMQVFTVASVANSAKLYFDQRGHFHPRSSNVRHYGTRSSSPSVDGSSGPLWKQCINHVDCLSGNPSLSAMYLRSRTLSHWQI